MLGSSSADEPHAELRGEPHALRLAAGKRGVVAVERQIAEAGFEEKMQALLDAGDDFAQRVVGAIRRDQLAGEVMRRRHVERHEGGKAEPIFDFGFLIFDFGGR